MQETRVQSLGWEEPLEEKMVTHSDIPAWKIQRTENLAGHSLRGHKELDATEHACDQLIDPQNNLLGFLIWFALFHRSIWKELRP